MQLQSLDWEDSLEEGMAAHSSILAWRISWTVEELDGLQSIGSQKVRHHWSDLACVHKEIKVHPRQSCLLKVALGKRSLSVVGKIKAGYPGKGLACAPFFLYSYDICAMPWRINWVIHGRLFYLSPGLQNMSPKMELSGTSWSGFTTPYKSGWLFLCCRLCFAKSVFWQIRSMRIWLLCLPTDLLSYFWPQDLQTSSRPEKWQTQHES